MGVNGLTAGPASAVDSGLARLVDELTARLRDGGAVDPEALIAEHPQHAAQLRRLLPAMALLADVSRSAGESPDGIGMPRSDDEGPIVGTLGDYQIVREVGRGGMGIVYEAEQLSLSRRVALKVLPFAATMDPRHLQRFRNESKAAASLRHDHIVHVYGVGCERGVHYYAMEFIEGQTLAAVIEELRRGRSSRSGAPHTQPGASGAFGASGTIGYQSLENTPGPPAAPTAPIAALSTERSGPKGREFYRTAAGLIADAADALEHAHQLGIIHRDVKPANLLLDAAGKLYVSDFGLARVGPDAGLTGSGDLLGTLRYMAPEQALARHGLVDHRADVYALGATLYELVTGHPAVDAVERAEILRKIAFEEPRAPRKFDKSIPAEMEVVTLKCLAKNPSERYATAGELADDLRRYLAHEPIRAKPPTLRQRATKWARRHRPVVTAAALFLLVAVVGTAVGSWLFWTERSNAFAAYKAEAEQGRRRAETLRKALEVLDEIYLSVAEHRLPAKPKLEKKDEYLLQKALTFYEDFAQLNAADPEVWSEAVDAYTRAGQIYYYLGRPKDAEGAYRQAIALGERFGIDHSGAAATREGSVGAYNALGIVLLGLGRPEEAEQALRKALDLWKQVKATDTESEEYRSELAGMLGNLGEALEKIGRHREADTAYLQAIALGEALVKDLPEEVDYQHILAATLHNRAALLMRSEDENPETARTLLERAIEYQKAFLKQNAGHVTGREFLRNHYLDLAEVLQDLEELEEAEAASREARTLAAALVSQFPGIPDHRFKWLECLSRLAELQADLERPKEAEATYRQAAGVGEQLVASFPLPLYRLRLAAILSAWSDMLCLAHRPQEALPQIRRALVLAEQATADTSTSVESLRLVGAVSCNLGVVLRECGELAESRQHLNEAVRKLRALQKANAGDLETACQLAMSLGNVGDTLARLADYRGALAAFDAIRELLPEEGWGTIDGSMARILATCPDDAIRDVKRAVDLAREAVAKEPKDGDCWATLALACFRAGEAQAALEAANKAAALLKEDDALSSLALALTFGKHGDPTKAQRWFDKSVKEIDQQKAPDPIWLSLRAEAAAQLPPTATNPVPVAAASLPLKAKPGAPGSLDTTFGGSTGYVTTLPAKSFSFLRKLALQGDKMIVLGSVQTQTPSGSRSEHVLMRFNADGTPDDAFGTKGTFQLGPSAGPTAGEGLLRVDGLAVQPDGRIVISATSANRPYRDTLIYRLVADGSRLDPTFAAGGLATLNFGPSTMSDNAGLALQADGRIVSVGTAMPPGPTRDNQIVLARLNPNGALDNTYGKGGLVFTNVRPGPSTFEMAKTIAIQGDGAIVVGSRCDNATFAITRHKSNGDLDRTFGDQGVAQIDLDQGDDVAKMALQTDGRIVLAANHGNEAVKLLCVTPTGQRDRAFPTDPLAGFALLNGLAVQSADGKLLAVGYSRTPAGNWLLVLARYNPNGTPDAAFGEGGAVNQDFPQANRVSPSDITIQPNGRIVVIGGYYNSATVRERQCFIARFDK